MKGEKGRNQPYYGKNTTNGTAGKREKGNPLQQVSPSSQERKKREKKDLAVGFFRA